MKAVNGIFALIAASLLISAALAPAAEAAEPAVFQDAAAELLGAQAATYAQSVAAAAGTHFDQDSFQVAVFKQQGKSPRKLDVQYLSSWIDIVTVLPGERFPLKALNAAGKAAGVTWRAKGGRLAYGERMAVWTAPLEAGVYDISGFGLVGGRTSSRTLHMLVTVPNSNVKDGKLNGYPIGSYPKGYGPKPTLVANRGSREDAYSVPAGFIELTNENIDLNISRHYRLRDFAGKDGAVGGKKYLFLETKLVEKLERLITTLNGAGYPCEKLEVMSAYRSPQLNARIGNETKLSRHTYGDAADVLAQDFNRDKKVDVVDGQILLAAVTKLDKDTELTGGASLYPPNGAHGYFVHTDTRGQLIRW